MDETNKKLRLAFAGTPELAATILKHLLENSSYQITIVLTQPDKLAGRGRKLSESAVKTLATKNNLPIIQPSKTELLTMAKKFAEVDLMIVVAYGVLLPENILHAPRYGCLNIHFSLLPKWRGAAPIQRAIQAGENTTGITFIQMDSDLDTGPILLQKKCKIETTDTANSLHEKLIQIANTHLIPTIEKFTSHNLKTVKQDHTQSSYAKKITKAEAQIDWTQTVTKIDYKIRAFNPTPICHTILADIKLRIWEAQILDSDTEHTSGKILTCTKDGIDIATGRGILRILRLQPPNKRNMSVADFLNGHPNFANSH